MVSTGKKRQSNRRLFRQLDDFDQDVNFGNAVSHKQQSLAVNEDTDDRVFIAHSGG